jgi:dUTP pyrophosphatase
MDKNDIKNYIKQLEDIEKNLLSEDGDLSLLGDLNNILQTLDNDIQVKTTASYNKMEIKIKKLNPNAVVPSYSKDGDAGMDLTATEIISETKIDVTYGTGISMEIPKGYVGLVFPRSSIRKYDLSLTNCVGVIDSGYRGEIQATFKKTNWLKGNESEKYQIGDRIVQIMIIPYPQVSFIEVEELSSSERGTGGFGSTGA